jgi:hypothetical protein
MSDDAVTKDHWGLAPYRVYALDENHFFLLRKSDGSSAVMDIAWKAVLDDLSVVRTLTEHAETIATTIPSLKGKTALIEQVLVQLVERGLFQGAGQLAAEARQAAKKKEQTPGALRVVITTCERPKALKRLLESLEANEARFGSRWHYEVIDDSRSEQAQEQNSELVRAATQRLDIEYLGQAEQRQFLDALFQEMPESQSARWLLERNARETEPTYGLPMNLALLRHAGGNLLMLDDDTVMRSAWLPDSRPFPRFDRNQQAEVFFTIEEARSALQPCEKDPLSVHADALGQLVSTLIVKAGGARPEASFIDEKSGHLASFDPQRSRVRYTLNGLMGDTGANNDLFVFAAKHMKKNNEKVSNDADYSRLKASDRIVNRVARWPSLYDSGWLFILQGAVPTLALALYCVSCIRVASDSCSPLPWSILRLQTAAGGLIPGSSPSTLR